jgi:hypothetical protein
VIGHCILLLPDGKFEVCVVMNVRIMACRDVMPCTIASEEPATLKMEATIDHSVDIVCRILGSLSSGCQELCRMRYEANRLCGMLSRKIEFMTLSVCVCLCKICYFPLYYNSTLCLLCHNFLLYIFLLHLTD